MNFDEIKDKIYPWIKKMINSESNDNQKEITVDIPEKSFLADLFIIFVVDSGDCFNVLQRSQMPEKMSEEELYELAVNNLANNIRFTLQPTNYGGYGIIADGNHEAGALCLNYLWEFCAEQIGENLIIAVPSKDMVLMVGQSQIEELNKMKILSSDIVRSGNKTLTEHLFLYSVEQRKFTVYE